ncbi:uncharacterized protein LOC134846139 isoform X2 [Symsagittifera roscoffensis]|uniref:uncharacterized protein LOC134846139 isoform X2 n=1 Tax=Symsagittifera roscoffensis TaxID=84072 RepID=UPI00307C1180
MGSRRDFGIEEFEKAANVNRLQNADYSATSVLTLLEHSRKKMWGNPIYIEMNEKGPLHRRLFHYKVRVNNVDYVPHTGSSSKKQAKADAATGALYALGLLKHPCIMTTPAS